MRNTKWDGNRMKKIKKLPLLWKHMIMMLCILLMAVFVLVSNHQKSLETLTTENLSKYQIALERDCTVLNEAMYMTSAIPDGIEGTRYYDYIKSVTTGELDTMYYPVLRYIRKALTNQIYLQGTNEVCLLYLAGCNSIVANEKIFPVAEDCFADYLTITQTGSETIMGYLRDRNTIKLLPTQQVRIGNGDYAACMSLIIHPRNSPMAVMMVYSQNSILDALGFSHLPEGTYLQLTAEDGQVLMQYPAAMEDDAAQHCHLLKSGLEDFDVSVKVWVPKAYFSQLLRPVQLNGLGSILAVTLLGALLAFFFSKASVTPIQKLILTHGGGQHDRSANEITHLDQLLRSSRQQSKDLHGLLQKQILARALSGTVLTEHDERYLEQSLRQLSGDYQVAILHGAAQVNPILGGHLQQAVGDLVWALLNDKETGVIFPSGEPYLSRLIDEVQALNTQIPDAELHCGISSPVIRLESLHIAARQARAALPQEKGAKLFPGGRIGGSSVSWLQHERLYQSISANDEDETIRLLQVIAGQTNHANAREAFYNIRFVLRSAAEEMNVEIDADHDIDYQANLLPRENIRNLANMVRYLFVCVRAKNQENAADLHFRMLEFVQQNLAEYELCAAMVAEHFQIPEKKVYEAVRQKTGMTFKEYLTSLRMKKAAELLYTTKDSIADIAQACGYRGSSTFYRLFQEYHGMAPGQYRKDESGK